MKKWLAAGLLLVILVGGCNQTGDKVEIEAGKRAEDYVPAAADIVNRDMEITNLERFNEFFENVQKGSKDNIRIVTYTIEGDPMLHDLDFDGDTIHSVRDTRRDKFGNGEITEMTCKKIDYSTNQTMADNVYKLTHCDKNGIDDSVLWY